MADYIIEAEPRTIVGKKVSQLRANGLVPATVYGAKMSPINVQIPYRPLQVALMKAGGTNVINLQVKDATHTVLAREVQRDYLKGTILHVDFFAVDQTTRVTADIPVRLVGESPAVLAKQGILLTGASSITVEMLATKLLHVIEVDLSKLAEVGDAIHVGDLNLGPDVRILNDPDETIARVSQTSAARAEEEEALEAVETSAEPEVIRRGKVEEEEE